MELIYTDWQCRQRNGFCIRTAICAIQLRRVSIIVEGTANTMTGKKVFTNHIVVCIDR